MVILVCCYSAAAEDSAASKTISVADCGAVGDGIQDDAPVIQKALDSGAAVITIPQGVYRIGRTLRIGSDTTLKADPQATIRLADGAGNHVDVFLLANRNPGNGNANITVEGGIWDGNNERNQRGKDGDWFGYTGVAIDFVHVRGLVVRNLTVRNPDSFSIRLGEVEDFVVEDIVLDHPVSRHNQDGVHVGGFSQRGVVRRIKGITPNTPNDDMVALNADDDVERVVNLGMRRGPIRNILVEDLEADNAYNFVRILSKEAPIEDITVRNVKGSCRYYAVNIGQWRYPVGSGDIRNVRIEQFDVSKSDKQHSLIEIALCVDNLQIRDFRRREDTAGADAPTLMLHNKHENILVGEDGQEKTVREYQVPKGDIQELRINRPAEPRP
jgi:polygalacturonase